jgi:hypothetical protein
LPRLSRKPDFEKSRERKIFFKRSYYCPQSYSGILNDTKLKKFNFKPLQLHLKNECYKTILKREVFIYFPVDFFEENKEFKKIYEWKLPQ